MPPRRSTKKKQGRAQKAAAASESLLLESGAASPAGSASDDGAVDSNIEDKENRGSSSSCSSRPARGGPSQHEQQTEYVEKIIEEIEVKAREWCDAIMDENAENIRAQKRARDRVKNKISRKFRNEKLADLCNMSGNDLNAALLMAVPPDERSALLAADGAGEEEEDNEEDMPTAVKGRNPPRMVPATPKGGGRPSTTAGRGRATRSSVKGVRSSSRTSVAAAELVPVAVAVAVAQTPTGRGGGGGASRGRVTRSAIKGEAPGGVYPSPPPMSIEDAPNLSERVIAELHKRFDPDCTVWQCLDLVFQPKIEGATRHAEAACAELRQNIAERSAQLRARVVPPDKKRKQPKAAKIKPEAKAKSKRAAAAAAAAATAAAAAAVAAASASEEGDADVASSEAMEEVEEEEVEEEAADDETGGTAKIALSIEGGPYDGSVFEISVEDNGDARLVGRSTGKKFKNHGISLRRDSEVSITHGMFMNSGGAVTFMDNGSTNGTEVDGDWVEPKKAYDIAAGSRLLIGQGLCTVAVTWER